MRRVLSVFTVFPCFCFLALALGASPVVAQVYGVVSPSSRIAAQSNASVTLSGWVLASGQMVSIEAVDQSTGVLQPLGTVNASTSGATYHALRCHLGNNPLCKTVSYTLYPWSYPAGQLAANYWAPQLSFAAGVSTSQGHLELVASAGGVTLPTFSVDALNIMKQSPLYHGDPEMAATQFSDGSSTVLFDQYGVGGAPSSWTTVAGMVANPPPPPPPNSNYPSVALSIGSYTVGPANNPITVYALICAPKYNGIFPMVIYNHGGINYGPNSPLGDIGSLHGHVTSSKWTAAPATGSDELGQCVDWAKRGWIFAMSTYRDESISIVSDDQTVFPTKTWTSSPTTTSGASEFCMGEVTDVMALVDLLVNHIGNITIGDPNNAGDQIHITTSWNENNPSISWSGQLFMYGYSHGGCITYRAVEQGAPVDAFTVIEGFTDQSLTYLNGLTACNNNPSTCTVAGVFDPTGFAAAGSGAIDSTGHILYYPGAAGVMGYNWRSAHYFASRGDLSIRKFATMPILILHGDIDAANPVPLDEPAELAADITAADIFYGPDGSAPANQPCITPPTGAPIVDPTTHMPLSGVPSSCMVPFTTMDDGDPCLTGSPLTFAPTPCKVILLPQPLWQQHYLVVYHNMDHFNGGLGIKTQFDRFAEQNFRRKPGCDGIPLSKATPPYSTPILCNGYE
ncbi:MAG: hypothetical protein WB495_09065 [Xanthobacteraceae bacterium]